jgi:hypothetical protein
MAPARTASISNPQALGYFQEGSRSTSRTPAKRRSGNSPPSWAFRHRLGMATLDLRFDVVEKSHTGSSRRKVLFDLDVPLKAISVREPSSKACLLLGRKRLYCLLDLSQVHIPIVLRKAATRGRRATLRKDDSPGPLPRDARCQQRALFGQVTRESPILRWIGDGKESGVHDWLLNAVRISTLHPWPYTQKPGHGVLWGQTSCHATRCPVVYPTNKRTTA